MKILILQASPRANGNTAWMAEEYKNAAEEAGHEVTLVNVSKKKIAGCLACEYCHTKGNGACIQKDDMQELYPLMNEAEVLVEEPTAAMRPLPMHTTRNSQPMSGTSGLHPPARPKVQTSRGRLLPNT